ncbi:hypothetical protein HaLaN_16327 [Haematococcus lacustris]|uniref:Uncharacterized protein n=1 Tax=Haematococcus lacustris TaxID=44745 RepID=A0A699ZK79_HAELA|nr:hypothetical protein HaLaN_16327 [Haematococcus lacustris]
MPDQLSVWLSAAAFRRFNPRVNPCKNESGKAVVPYRKGGWWFNGRGSHVLLFRDRHRARGLQYLLVSTRPDLIQQSRLFRLVVFTALVVVFTRVKTSMQDMPRC